MMKEKDRCSAKLEQATLHSSFTPCPHQQKGRNYTCLEGGDVCLHRSPPDPPSFPPLLYLTYCHIDSLWKTVSCGGQCSSCKECDYAVLEKDNLNTHKKTAHNRKIYHVISLT